MGRPHLSLGEVLFGVVRLAAARISALCLLLGILIGCGSSDQAAVELKRQNELEQARRDAAQQTRQQDRLRELEQQVQKQKRRRGQRTPEAAAPSADSVVPATSSPVPEVAAESFEAFHTGTDPGKDMPAALCRISSGEAYCWTPNDGYTLRLTTGSPERIRADEAANRGRVLDGYDFLRPGDTRSAYGVSCTSRETGLTCENSAGHGWTLPRYVGLPALF